MTWQRYLFATCLLGALCFTVTPGSAASSYGKLKGVVRDPEGTPQMGATVVLDPEAFGGGRHIVRLLSDQDGVFRTPRLQAGLYSVHVTLAGFLPAILQNVRVQPDLTTLVHVDLESVFTSVDQLRRPGSLPSEKDDWKWVLRSSSSTRSILQWVNGGVLLATDTSGPPLPRARIELTNGARQPGSSSAVPGPPATAVSYDQKLGGAGRLLLGGEMIYNPGAGPGLAFSSIWLPDGKMGAGPETTVVMRQERIGPGEQTIRRLRIEHSQQMTIGNRVMLDYGAEYLMAGIDTMTASVRPHGRVAVRIAPHWTAAFGLETEPDAYRLGSHGLALESALDAMDTLPVLIWQNGRAAMEGGWHEEASLRHEVGRNGVVEVAAFHDSTRHQAVFGFDSPQGINAGLDICPGSGACAYDGGPGRSWGSRVVYRQKLTSNLEADVVYAWAGALTLNDNPDPGSELLQDTLRMRYRHSVAARVAGKLPRVDTQFAASYKWLSGAVVSRQDLFGEAALGIDPNLSLVIRQPLPYFHGGGHWEALADFRNLLSQGYVPVNGPEGKMVLVPVLRSIRGGVSFQF